jgi:hypothetical protein
MCVGPASLQHTERLDFRLFFSFLRSGSRRWSCQDVTLISVQRVIEMHVKALTNLCTALLSVFYFYFLCIPGIFQNQCGPIYTIVWPARMTVDELASSFPIGCLGLLLA